VSGEAAARSSRHERLEAVILPTDYSYAAFMNPRFWISLEVSEIKTETTILVHGFQGTTVYGFHSKHGDCFALIIYQSFSASCYVDFVP
jgi:hypothetical protein